MKTAFLFCCLLATITSFTQTNANMAKIKLLAEKWEDSVIAWRRDLHQHPELGNREFRTAAIVAAHLQTLGLEVKTGIAKTGVVGILKGGKPGPVVALRADMDGLPVTERTQVPFASTVKSTYNGQEVGVMHACGHDTHVAILLGTAEILSALKKDIKGTVVFLFQPAEEGAPKGEEGGAQLMIKEGVLDNPKVDVVFGLHINAQLEVGKIGYRPGGFMASASDMKIIVKGRGSHGAYPWYSTDPIVTAAQIITNLQTIVSRNLDITENAGVVTIGAISGGTRFNIIPEQVEMQGTVRALKMADEQMMMDKIRLIATKTAEANGDTAEVLLPYSVHYPITFNDSALSYKMLPTLQRAAGAANSVLIAAKTGAEDFSFYEQKVPGIFFNLGGMPKGKDPKTSASHHTPEFFVDESGFKTGMAAMAALVLDYGDLSAK